MWEALTNRWVQLPGKGIVEESGRDGQQSHALARKPIHGLAAVMNIGPHNSKHRKHMQATPSWVCDVHGGVSCDGYGQKMAAAAACLPACPCAILAVGTLASHACTLESHA